MFARSGSTDLSTPTLCSGNSDVQISCRSLRDLNFPVRRRKSVELPLTCTVFAALPKLHDTANKPEALRGLQPASQLMMMSRAQIA